MATTSSARAAGLAALVDAVTRHVRPDCLPQGRTPICSDRSVVFCSRRYVGLRCVVSTFELRMFIFCDPTSRSVNDVLSNILQYLKLEYPASSSVASESIGHHQSMHTWIRGPRRR